MTTHVLPGADGGAGYRSGAMVPIISFMATLKLGAFADNLHGRAGNTVFVRSAGGVVVREHVIPRDPQTELQMAARLRLMRAGIAWNELEPEQAERWRDYALRIGVREPGTGAVRARRAQNVFCGLACKLLQAVPNATIPLDPPDAPFFGDAISISVQPAPSALDFDASAPNQPTVLTELLVQPLRHGAMRPKAAAYRSKAFVTYAPGSLRYTLSLSPGWYAAAYRFVQRHTGEESPLVPLGVVRVMA
ncbi:MAG: hypothetical protein K1X67_25595 [Fimbriimonadaceae bacterium]|nr:hypothetical protein [Fimbriimonadaceae bacterium]